MNSKLFQTLTTKNPSPKERHDLGKSVRKQVARSTIGQFTPVSKRQSPIDILLAQEKTRIPEYVPIRHARMAADPFAFFRGGAALMASDLSKVPSPPIQVQLCGDMHVSNFGFFSTTEHQLVFGINDFDETLPGNFDWDLKRLVASTMIAAKLVSPDQTYAEDLVRTILKSYRNSLRYYAELPYVTLKRTFIDQAVLTNAAAKYASDTSQRYLKHMLHHARANSSGGLLGKLTISTPDGIRLINNPPFIEHLNHSQHGYKINEIYEHSMFSYIDSLPFDRKALLLSYKWLDKARKIVGVGSVGTGCWVFYLEGLNAEDPLFLQMKGAQKSVLAPYFSDSKFNSHGARVVSGQSLIQGAPDLFLGYGTCEEGDFYLRQLRDMKGGISIGSDGINVDTFPDFARLFGWALANAHARSGDAAALVGYCGNSDVMDEALVNFAKMYSLQNDYDYDTFMKAIKTGKLSCAASGY